MIICSRQENSEDWKKADSMYKLWNHVTIKDKVQVQFGSAFIVM